jgi:hypothetical protein
MLTHPYVRLSPLELLALNRMSELVPRILEKSLLSHPNRRKGFNKSNGVGFYFKTRAAKPKFMLVNRLTKEQVSPLLYTEKQVRYLLGVQKPSSVHQYVQKKYAKLSPVYNIKVKVVTLIKSPRSLV